jgi:hypothetical protein
MCGKKTICLLLAGFLGITAVIKGALALLGVTMNVVQTPYTNAVAFVVDGLLALVFLKLSAMAVKKPKKKR